MKSKFVLDTLPAAHALAVDVLKKADRVFYRQRRIMEDSYGMTHGVPRPHRPPPQSNPPPTVRVGGNAVVLRLNCDEINSSNMRKTKMIVVMRMK